MIRIECHRFEISLNRTKELKELELIFVLDGILMDEDKMIDIIRVKLEKAANGTSFEIESWIRQGQDIDEETNTFES